LNYLNFLIPEIGFNLAINRLFVVLRFVLCNGQGYKE